MKEKGERGSINRPFYGTWVVDFITRQDAGMFTLGKYLSDKSISWRRRRLVLMAVEDIMPTTSHLPRIGKMQSAGCRLCRRSQEARGESTDNLAVERCSHINSACCEWMAPTVMATGHSICRHLYGSMHAAQQPNVSSSLSRLMKKVT